ncbi:hypothetical protein [Priestia megaterium]|uniref:hypothetical protein n=1 Tax=Priestia megaterium TaxID=1404 RepID=UPI0023DA0507|nr:hypothetical protein [Priestia megaterium]MDF2014671.1 hypothetical protein [Priestia megaterium]
MKEQVKQICNRLAPHGWRDLLCQHNLDITEPDLETELKKELINIDRRIKGFEDFALEGKRGIEPGQPARSLLYHALASPNVTTGVNGSKLGTFPTLAELEIIENYVYGIEPPSIENLYSFANGDLAVVVFASEYRPAPETVHRKHADLCFSRTGLSRVGTEKPLYCSQYRGFLPDVKEDDFAFRVLPARYSAYIAIKRQGNKNQFGPMRFNKFNREEEKQDEQRMFWVPIHKLFNGKECIKNLDLEVKLEANHVNEKLRRVHLELNKRYDDFTTGWGGESLKEFPFRFTEGIAEWSNDPDLGSNILVPVPHTRFVERAQYNGELLTFNVPKDVNLFSSSLEIESDGTARRAPEYVHIRHRLLDNGRVQDLNKEKEKDIVRSIKENSYPALHYIDYTGDGWIEAECPQIVNDKIKSYSAYSLVTAPDFFPNCDQRELMDWFDNEEEIPREIQDGIWERKPYTLSDNRIAANLELKGARFSKDDDTMTTIVSSFYEKPPETIEFQAPVATAIRHSCLPDAASGIFAPGWDVSYDRTLDGKEFLAAYGLGSPFPEDVKLCAALSTFWPAVAPDAARTFEPVQEPHWPTVSPLTDSEIGQKGDRPWDGTSGPRTVRVNGEEKIEYASIDYVDYVENALQNKYTLSLTKLVDVEEYKNRVLAMAYVYTALGISLRNPESYQQGKRMWNVLSFLRVPSSDQEFQIAQSQASNLSFEMPKEKNTLYRFELFQHVENDKEHPINETEKSVDFSKYRIGISNKVICFVNETNILIKHGNSDWKAKIIKDWEAKDV